MSSTQHGHRDVHATRREVVTSSRQQKESETPARSATRPTSSSGRANRPTSSTMRPSSRVTGNKGREASPGAQNKPSIGARDIPRSAPTRSKQKPLNDVPEAVTSPLAARRDTFKPLSPDLACEPRDVVVEPSSAAEHREHTALSDECVEDMDDDTVEHDDTQVDFQVPDKREAEHFEASTFLGELRTLSECLQVVLRRQLVDDLEADRLDKMVFAVSVTIGNFKEYSACVQKLLETIRDQMKTVADLVFKMVLQPAVIGRGLDASEHSRRNRALNVAEAELSSRQHRLNSQLAKANENLQRATVVALEADSACTQATIVAEQATEQARLAQAEYEERCRIEQEIRKQAEERKASEDRLAAEAEHKREQRRLADEQRRAAARRPPTSNEASSENVVNDWPILVYEAGTSRDYDGGLACLIQADSDYHQQDSFTCDVIDPVQGSFNSLFGEHEELLSNIIHISRTSQLDATAAKKRVLVSLPYCPPLRPAMREPVVKCCTSSSTDAATWQSLTTVEVAFDSHKAVKFVQAEVTSFPIVLCVVLRPRKDYLYLSRRADKVTVSELDKNITFSSSHLSKREHFTLQIQTIDHDVKTRLTTIKELLAASSMFTMHWASTTFTDKVTITVPVPANPVKLAKLSASRAGREGKRKPSGPEPGKASQVNAPQPLPKENATVELNKPSVEENKETVNKSAVRRWYMGQYDTTKDDDTDILYLVQKTNGGKWITEEQVTFTELKIDLVEFKVKPPLSRFIILRTRTTVTNKMAEAMAENVEQIIRKRSVCSVVKQRIDNPSCAVHLIVPLNRLDRTLKRLYSQGYEIGPEPSKEFYLSEGERLALSFHNNICFRDEASSLPTVFFNNLDLDRCFTMKEVDRFLQKQFNSYRGVMQIARRSFAGDIKETGKQTEDGSKNGDDHRMAIVASHLVNIPKVDESTAADGFQSTSDQQAARSSVFIDPPQDFPAGREIHVLKYLAGELGDEWLTVSHWLQVRATRIQNIRRRADSECWDDCHMKLEMLACWFKTQPRSVDKISILCGALRRSGRDDLALRLIEWKKKGTPLPAANEETTATVVR